MAASNTDKFRKATSGTRPSPTTLTAIKLNGASSASCNALTGWPTDTGVDFILYNIDTNGNKVAGTQTDWVGVVSGTNLTNIVLKAGTDTNYSIGTIVESSPTAAYATDLAANLLVQHNQDGTHGAITATSVVNAGNETIGGTLGVTGIATFTAKPVLPAQTVTPTMLATGAATSAVATSESTASTTYVGLTTAQTVTVTVGSNGLLLVTVGCGLVGTGGNQVYNSFALSGANTLASADANGVSSNNQTTDAAQYDRVKLLTGLSAGSTTVTAQFRVGGGTGTFKNRSLVAIPL